MLGKKSLEKILVKTLVDLGAMPVTIVPRSHFSRLEPELLGMAWQLVGPSVQVNLMQSGRLWEIFAACYIEGVNHGVGWAREKQEQELGAIPIVGFES